MNPNIVFPALVVALGAVVFVAFARDSVPPAPDEVREPASAELQQQPEAVPQKVAPVVVPDLSESERTIDGIVMPAEFFAELAPGQSVEFEMPTGFKSGVKCPDGSYLPLLNGVPEAWPISRHPEDGPMPPVIGLVADAGGYRWYKHADGTVTTTRWAPFQKPDGTMGQRVQTSHHVPQDPSKYGLGADGTPPASGSSNGGDGRGMR